MEPAECKDIEVLPVADAAPGKKRTRISLNLKILDPEPMVELLKRPPETARKTILCQT